VEAISMYNSMKENLMEYLAKFAQNGKVVREEDIKQFFEVKCSAIPLAPFLFVTTA
jgi:E3 ubiquitin-protein ligase UBR7